MKLLAALCLLALSAIASAAPTIVADAYPAGAGQPTTATLTVTGMAGPPITCALTVNVDHSVQPMCDVGSLTTAGTYPLVLTVSNVATIYNSPDGTSGTYTAGGSASTPFSYTVSSGLATSPGKVRLSP